MSLPQELLDKYDVDKYAIENPIAPPTFVSHSNEPRGSDYSYISKLIDHPVTEGRHRLLWQVVAPYAVNVLKLERSDAEELVAGYIEECSKLNPTDAGLQVDSFITHAIIIGLLPPRLETIQRNDSELYDIVMAAIDSNR